MPIYIRKKNLNVTERGMLKASILSLYNWKLEVLLLWHFGTQREHMFCAPKIIVLM